MLYKTGITSVACMLFCAIEKHANFTRMTAPGESAACCRQFHTRHHRTKLMVNRRTHGIKKEQLWAIPSILGKNLAVYACTIYG